jgi:hypothetical protein
VGVNLSEYPGAYSPEWWAPSERNPHSSDKQRKWRPFGGVFTVLGVLFAAVSITSLIQRWSSTTLAELAGEILTCYRAVMGQAKWALFDWWTVRLWPDWHFPLWGMDVISLWFFVGAFVWRGEQAKAEIYQARLADLRRRGKYIAEVDRLYADFHRVLRDRYGLALLITPLALCLFVKRTWIDSSDVWTDLQFGQGFWRHGKPLVVSIIVGLSPLVGAALFFSWNAIAL